MANELILQNLTKTFMKDGAPVTAVNAVNLHVEQGEFLTFLGPSGCGKTTTLRMIAGFEKPTSGKILLGDRDITDLAANKRDLGFVFQNYALFPHMTVGKNVGYGLTVRGISGAELTKRVEEALELVGLAGTSGRYPNQLSGGEQQRVALARALVLRPKLLLMDEPLSNLDAKLRARMRGEIRRIQKSLGLTCLYVTHDQKEALTMSDRIMVMRKGTVQQLGTPEELYSDPATPFVADFIGSANLIPGTVAEGAPFTTIIVDGTPLQARRSKTFTPGNQKALLALRPGKFRPAAEEEPALEATVTLALFEGDKITYQGRLTGGTEVEFTLPFTPGQQIAKPGDRLRLTFDPAAGVIINE